MKLTLKSLVWLLLPFVFASCQDHLTGPTSPTGTRFRIKQYSQGAPRLSNNNTVFMYDAANRLISYRFVQNALDKTTTLQYDAQGRLIASETPYSSSGPYASYYDQRTSYGYDINGNLSTVVVNISSIFNPTPALTLNSSSTLTYGSDKYPTTITTDYISSTLVTRYTYANGNVASRTDTRLIAGRDPITTTTTFRYDNSPNPFYGLILPFGPFGNLDYLSKNNVIQADTQYIYDANGLLTNKYFQQPFIGGSYFYENYTYEMY